MTVRDNLEKLNTYWSRLNNREKLVSSFGIVFVILFLFYISIWNPTARKIEKLRHSVPKKEKQLATMKSQALVIKRTGNKNSGITKGNVLSRVEITSKRLTLTDTIKTMEPQGEDGVRLVMDEVEFNRVLDYINQLASEGIHVENATFDSGDTPGMVSARLLVKGKQ